MTIKDLQSYEPVLTPEQSEQLAAAKAEVRYRFPESVGVMHRDNGSDGHDYQVIGRRNGKWYYVSMPGIDHQSALDAWKSAAWWVKHAKWDAAAATPALFELVGGVEPAAETPAPAPDKVNHPAHYGGELNPYEAIKVINAWNLGFNLGNSLKYLSRAGKKSGESREDDLSKARWYLDWEIRHGTEYRDKLPSRRLRRWLVRLAWAVPLALVLADWLCLRLDALLNAFGGGR